MKRIISMAVLILTCSSLLAQKKKDNYPLSPAFPVTIDGDLKEWTGKMNLIDPDSSWMFGITHDSEFLYVAVRIKDASLQQEAVRNGVVVNINQDGKKKDGARLIFPIPDSETLRAIANDDNLPNLNIREELIKRSRGYGVLGFAHIVDGRLSFDNSYQVQVDVKLLENQVLVYESKIPIESIGIKNRNKEVAIQVMINNRYAQLQKLMKSRPAARNDYYSRYGGVYGAAAPSIKSPYKMKTDVWIVGKLNE